MSEPFELEIFENAAEEHEGRHWYAEDVMALFGYQSQGAFEKVVIKSMATCATLGIDFSEAFITTNRRGKLTKKFTRFACFLIAMHADDKKAEVKQARVYLAACASSILDREATSEDLARIELREELKGSEKIMCSAAQDAGIKSTEFGIFKDSGFRGMYNMPLAKLKDYKGLTKGVLYDFMGQTELAGNFFRVTQTAERIKAYRQKGLSQICDSARAVGEEVRRMMIKNSDVKPENLPLVEDIKFTQKRITGTHKQMVKFDQN